MTNQLQGEILFQGWAGTSDDATTWAYTPWLPVRGDFAVFAVEINYNGGASLGWEVQTRKLEDSTPTSILTGMSGASSGINTVATQELVRYRFKVPGTASTTIFVVFRALQPSWQVDR